MDITVKIILELKNRTIAKYEAAFTPNNPDWCAVKQETMKPVPEAKVKSYPEFTTASLKTQNNILAEAVHGDYCWSTELDKVLLMSTKKNNWPGQNVMLELLYELRKKLMNIEKQKKDFTISENVKEEQCS